MYFCIKHFFTIAMMLVFSSSVIGSDRETPVPAPLKSVKFNNISRNTTVRNNSKLSSNGRELRTEFKPRDQVARVTIELVFDVSDKGGNFAAPIVISKNPNLVKVTATGKINPPRKNTVRTGRCIAALEAKPVTNTQSVEIECIWGTEKKTLTWILSRYDGPNNLRLISVSPSKPRVGNEVSIIFHLDYDAPRTGRTIEFKFEPANAFERSGSTAYSQNSATFNQVTVASGDDAVEVRLRVLEAKKKVSVKTWVDGYRGESPRDGRYKRKDFTTAGE